MKQTAKLVMIIIIIIFTILAIKSGIPELCAMAILFCIGGVILLIDYIQENKNLN